MTAYFREYRFYVYIVAGLSGTLYVGMTNDLIAELLKHKLGETPESTKKYGLPGIVLKWRKVEILDEGRDSSSLLHPTNQNRVCWDTVRSSE
jgi:hypothetical protein